MAPVARQLSQLVGQWRIRLLRLRRCELRGARLPVEGVQEEVVGSEIFAEHDLCLKLHLERLGEEFQQVRQARVVRRTGESRLSPPRRRSVSAEFPGHTTGEFPDFGFGGSGTKTGSAKGEPSGETVDYEPCINRMISAGHSVDRL